MKPSGGRSKRSGEAGGSGANPQDPGTPGGDDAVPQNPQNPQNPGGPANPLPGDPEAAAFGLSSNPNVRFKPVDLMEVELSDTLALKPAELCTESGGASCIRQVHLVALGGTSPYDGGNAVPIAESMITTPIAWERIVLTACGKRARMDLDQPGSATIFANLPLDADGHLKDAKAPEVALAIDTLYKRALKRPATVEEIGKVQAFYAEVKKLAPADSAREWARMSCYAVLTSVEFIFY